MRLQTAFSAFCRRQVPVAWTRVSHFCQKLLLFNTKFVSARRLPPPATRTSSPPPSVWCGRQARRLYQSPSASPPHAGTWSTTTSPSVPRATTRTPKTKRYPLRAVWFFPCSRTIWCWVLKSVHPQCPVRTRVSPSSRRTRRGTYCCPQAQLKMPPFCNPIPNTNTDWDLCCRCWMPRSLYIRLF